MVVPASRSASCGADAPVRFGGRRNCVQPTVFNVVGVQKLLDCAARRKEAKEKSPSGFGRCALRPLLFVSLGIFVRKTAGS